MSSDSANSRSDQVRSGSLYQRILVATDFSRISGYALGHAYAIARQLHAKLFLVHVIPKELPFVPPEAFNETIGKAREYGQKELKKLAAVAGLDDLEHHEILAEGPVWSTLQDLIRSELIDLLVIGTHGRTSNRTLALGSVAEEIFRSAACPVLTVGPQAKVPEGATPPFKNLLYATNFKPHAERASSVAYYLEREHPAHLSVLHVVEEAGKDLTAGNHILNDFLVKRMRKTMPAECLNRCEPDFLVRFGEPGEEILHAATASHADLIILGLRPAEKLAGYLPSAVAYRIVCQASCPVLTLRR